MSWHFSDESIDVITYEFTYFKKLGKSSDSASQPGQRQRPLTNRALVLSESLKGQKYLRISIDIICQ